MIKIREMKTRTRSSKKEFKTLFLIGFSVIASSVLSYAQTINWEQLDMDNAFGYTSTVDDANNIITVAAGPGQFQSTSLKVRKYDVDGNLLFETSIAAENINTGVTDNAIPYQVETDAENNIVIGGVNTIINTSTSSSCFTPPCYFPSAAKIWKLTPDGELVFNKTLLDHSNGFQQLLVDDDFIEIDDQGNIYYAGAGLITDTEGETAFGTILVKLAPDGTTIFTDVEDIVGSGNSIGRGFLALGSDFVAIANTTTFDEELTAWDGSGNVLWNINLSSSINRFRAIAIDPETNDSYILAETFPPDPIIIKVNSDGEVDFTEIYDLGESTVVEGLGFVGGDTLAFGATSWSDLGNSSTFYATLVSKSDGSILMENSHAISENLSRIRDFETNPDKGEYFAAVNSTTNGGAPSTGTVHAYYADGSEWHATNPNTRVRSISIGLTDEVYITTDNIWDLYQYTSGNDCSGLSAAITNFQDELCPGSCNGQATVELLGGEPPYSYEWSDPGSQTNQTATGLCDGSYTVVVTDNNNCTATATVNIGTTGNINAPTTVDQNESCDGRCDGVVTVSPSGGSSPYTYLWSDPAAQTTETASDLCPGVYLVTVTDNNGCSTIGTALVQDGPQQTTPIFSFNSNLCLGNDPIDLPVISNNGVSGTWSGAGVITNTFDPESAGIGNHDILFTPDTEQCAENVVVAMTVENCNCLNPPTASAGDDQSLCADLSLTVPLNGFIQGVSGASWTTDGTGTFNDAEVLDATYTPSQADFNTGSVTLTLTTIDPDGSGPCLPASDQVVIEFTLQPSIGIYEDVEVCFAFDLPPISGDVTGNAAYYTEPNGAGDQLLPGETITETTQIYVYDSTGQGCSDEEVFNILVNPLLIDGNGEPLCFADGTGTATWNDNCDSRPGIFYLYQSGSENLVESIDVEISDQGIFELGSLPTGTFDLYLKIDGFLQKSLTNVDLTTEVVELDFGVLTPGDINGDNAVSLPDFSAFSTAYGTSIGDASYNALADFNCDGEIDIQDYAVFSSQYGSIGDSP